jgi:hypothetical protein
MPAKPQNEELQAQTQLTRTIEAALKVAVPDADEIRFRGSLLRCATAQLATLKPAFVTRLYEAACDVKYPSDEVTEFRKALQVVIARGLNLKQYRNPAA